jgi:pyruvate-formate lyase-activating enzyme
MQTNVYNIAFAESTKQAYLHFWGCNIQCKGCVCQKVVFDFMLDRNMHLHLAEPRGIVAAPTRFMDFDDVLDTLVELDVKWVLFEGQEASLDPQMPLIAEALHRRLNTTNVLLTNGYHMPDLRHIDKVAVGLKALDEKLHLDYTGQSNKTILENFKKIYRSGVPMMAETVLIPGYIDYEEIEKIAKFIASIDKNIRYQIDAYFKAGNNPWRRPTTDEVERAVEATRKHLTNAYAYNGTEPREFGVKSVFPSEAELDAAELAPAVETRELVYA